MQNPIRKHCLHAPAYDLAMHIGQTLKKVMKERGVTPGAMAEHCGVSRGAVSNWFSTGRITKENLVKAASKLRLTVEQIVAGDLGDRSTPPLEPLTEVSDGTFQMLALMEVFSRLDVTQRQSVLAFALNQEKGRLTPHETARPPNLTPGDPGAKRRRTPSQDQGAISQTPLSGSSAGTKRRARK